MLPDALQGDNGANLIALGSLLVGFAGLSGIALALIQLRDFQKQRLGAETIGLIDNLEAALSNWRQHRFVERPVDRDIDDAVAVVMGRYEVFASLINRRSLPRGTASFALSHMKAVLAGMCRDLHGSRAITVIAQDINVYDEIRYCILARPLYFNLLSDPCLQTVMFSGYRPALFRPGLTGVIYRTYWRLRIGSTLDIAD